MKVASALEGLNTHAKKPTISVQELFFNISISSKSILTLMRMLGHIP